MTSPDEINQFECRWRPKHDFSPIASSFSQYSATTTEWFNRVRTHVRPVNPDLVPGAPSLSLAYLTFSDGQAAVIWRQWDLNAASLPGSGSKRPLVARVMVGSQRSLRPAVAMCLCRTGITHISGLAPGQVNPHMPLPSISSGQLFDLADLGFDDLEDGARKESGLGRLIAAALRDHSTALAIELPAQDLGSPIKGSQALLLWGLWCTTRRLLSGIDPPHAGPRGWSFSTYERALESSDTRGMADMVFRVREPHPEAPQLIRREVTVTPRNGGEPASPDDYDLVGKQLADAYRSLGGQELDTCLNEACLGSRDLLERLSAVSRSLAVIASPSSSVMGVATRGTTNLADQQTPPALPGIQPGLTEPDPYALRSTAGPSIAADMEPAVEAGVAEETVNGDLTPYDDIAEDTAAGTTTGRPLGRATPPAGPARVPGDAAGACRPSRSRPPSVAILLDRLATGPGSPEFVAALDALHDGRATSGREDRASARHSMAGCRWYVPELASHDPWHIEAHLRKIFGLTVIPDLADHGVRNEIANWVDERDAPTSVIRALIAAAHEAGQTQVSALEHAMMPALYRRWLIDHAVYTGPAARLPSSPQQSSPARRYRWQVFVAGQRSAIAASVLIWVCLGLVTALVLALLFI